MKEPGPRSKVSQQAIARRFGVSQALVSMVLNGRSDRVKGETYRKIWDYATGVGYEPKGMRSEFAHGEPEKALIGFILRARQKLYTQSNFYSHVQHGLHEFLNGGGHSTVFLGTEAAARAENFRALGGWRKRLHGVVLMGEMKLDFVEEVRARFSRVVSVSACYPGLCHSVRNNESRSLELLVDHLISLGHGTFAWIGGNFRLGPHLARLDAFKRQLVKRGLPLEDKQIVASRGGDRMDGREAARLLLDRFSPENLPTAWIAYNGLMARGVVNYLATRGIEVPGRISVAAVDATRVCEEEKPSITGAFADLGEMGRMAGRLLVEEPRPVGLSRDLVLPAFLTVRESTGLLLDPV